MSAPEACCTLAAPEEDCEDSSGSETEPAPAFRRQLSTKEASKGAAACTLEGYLLKQTCSFQRWRRRYFRLRGRKLYYAKQAKAAIFDEIDLRDASVAECSVRGSDYLGFQVITANRSLVLCADSRSDMEEWMAALRAAAAGDPEIVTVPGSGRPRAMSTSAQAEVLSGNHHWYASSHARPTYCNVCREALSGVTSHGLSCEVCKMKVHKRCACKTLNNCKWTTLASVGHDIIEEADGNITMPHQWMEGNLPVSAKCSVCEKTCGSVLRLQDWRCLWCTATVHTACRPQQPVQCTLGPAKVSVVPPTSLHSAGSEESWDVGHGPKLSSPLLVFVNSRSGDNQGLRFLRRFRQLLNPAQVFDLVSGGPALGLKLFHHLKPFRVLVCGGDGSVGWVLTEIDRLGLHRHCRVGVLPLGTGNDLARVLGWGSACDHDANLPQLLERYEQATTKMLDRWSVLCLEREVVQPGQSNKGAQHEGPDLGSISSVVEESETGEGEEVDEDEEEVSGVGEIPFVDMPGPSLEEELEEDAIAAAKLLCDRAERFLTLAEGEEGDELTIKVVALKASLTALKGALHDHDDAITADKSQPNGQKFPHRRTSCRRKVVSKADSLETALSEVSNLIELKQPPELEEDEEDGPRFPVISASMIDPATSSTPFLPPSSYLGPTLTTNFPLLVNPVHSRPASPFQGLRIPSPLIDCLRPPSPASFEGFRPHSPGSFGSDQWIAPPPSMFADGLLPPTSEAGSPPCSAPPIEVSSPPPTSESGGGGIELPCVVVSAPSPEHDAPSPLPSPDENLLFDPIFFAEYRRSSHDGTYGRRSNATRRISSGCLFGELQAPNSPAPHQRSPSPRHSIFNPNPRGSLFSPRGSVAEQGETNRKLPIINPLVRSPAWPNVTGGASGGLGFISQALLANADTLCAAVSPLMDHDDSLLEGFYERCVMNNYFGIGIDAKISLAFHQKREEHPEQCRSRARNYMWYGVLGSREALKRSCRKLEQRLTLECDGQRIPLPALQGIVVLNIPSFMGGTNFWGGSKSDECFLAPSFDDRVLEVVAVFGSVQMAASRILSAQSHRIAQCSSVQISIIGEEGVPVQVDGEAWVQPPGIIRIIHKNRMQMLCRNRALENSLRSWEEKQRQLSHEKPLLLEPQKCGALHNISDDERLALIRFIEAATSLIKCVKLLFIANHSLPDSLYTFAEEANRKLEALHPGGKMVESSELPVMVSHMVAACRELQEEACHIVSDLPKAEDELTPKLSAALLAMASQLQNCQTDPNTGLISFLTDDQSKSRSSPLPGLGWFKLKNLRRGSSTEDASGKSPRVGRASVETWGAQEVATWLTALGLTEYRDNFTQNDIQGRELLSLGRRDLRELGVEKLGHVKRILQGIKDLQAS
ncbi:diacylglycerol kinase eta-like isoform X2 [Neocloeon triangulifer]|uniref:diacylglycerol kinase eta-like isoform X2 n=1 Tax=Neocloeon triangulifer TaxID=2078957 RepID=UPI00286F00C6|nr:diacylglycerol kinase eta-like isoform X2 [Neocloeon triangulifer]